MHERHGLCNRMMQIVLKSACKPRPATKDNEGGRHKPIVQHWFITDQAQCKKQQSLCMWRSWA